MAYFGSTELLDSIQYGLAIEDDTGFSTKVLGKAVRRCKPGGLPLSLAAQTDFSDSDHSPPFQIRHFDNNNLTSALCQQSIGKKVKDVQNLIQARRNEKPKLNQEKIDHYFSRREVPSEKPQPLNSVLSRQIEGCSKIGVSSEKFNEFLKYEAFENEPNSKLINVIFPFAEHSPNQPPQTLSIRAKNTTSMDDFVGLCCFLYTRANFKPKCLEPWRYSLYMADESYDYDSDLPPVDRNRSVGECGFPILALVESKDGEVTKTVYTVNVYTISGHKFVFELDSLNQTLEWLRDEALKKRQELDSQQRLNMRQTVYELQSLDNEEPLKLTKSIHTTGLLDFLLIRKNSSRANFNPYALIDASNDSMGSRAPLFVQTRQRPGQLAPLSSSSTSSPRLFNNIDSPTTSVRSGQLGQSNLIQEYVVERIHRLKPKYTIKLAIRHDCLEITPVSTEKRRAFVPQTSQKYTTISWDLIAGIDSERHGSRRTTKIFWLPLSTEMFELQERYQKHLNRMQKKINDAFYSDAPPQQLNEGSRFPSNHSGNTETDTTSSSPSKTAPPSARPSVNEGQFNGNINYDYNPIDLLKVYENLSWKSIVVDANDEDSWQISMKIIEIIDAKNSVVSQIFKNSLAGSRRPKTAAEETFNLRGSYSPSESKRQSMATSSSISNLKAYKKRKSINPVPLLNRMLSKQE